jgi:hypothetical protein
LYFRPVAAACAATALSQLDPQKPATPPHASRRKARRETLIADCGLRLAGFMTDVPVGFVDMTQHGRKRTPRRMPRVYPVDPVDRHSRRLLSADRRREA